MWLWDSCYHSLAANLIPGATFGHNLGWEYVQSVLLGADASGAIAIERTPDTVGTKVTQTQPPLLAWAVYENYVQVLRPPQPRYDSARHTPTSTSAPTAASPP